ncbi:hypothetical protein [Corynebacterium halotolerans]|uniref:hypothetical protein n=1 Tax=Corynebacterium halotolerans TaxID=225326 RepID=UPI0003464871|nr:hypothetical protein [Corynebacterium halotolerans]
MQLLDQGITVVAVPDLMNVSESEHERVLAGFSMETEPLTEKFVEESGLTFWNDRRRTGWACGDYVFYRALGRAWDYAWIIEPDVYFLNGTPSLLPSLAELDTDLITTNFWQASENWYWRKPLADILPSTDVHAMAFPLARVSRRLAESAFELRKRLVSEAKPGSRIPNDESVLATAAHMSDFTALDLKKKFPSEFRYWSTVLKYPINDLRAHENQPLVIHSGLEDEDFMSYAMALWESLKGGSVRERDRLLKVLNVTSVDSMRRIFAQISAQQVHKDASSGE